jgi:hypothetical protein
MSPQALLGKEPIVTDRFPLTFNGNSTQPPWSALARNLTEGTGVKAVKVRAAIEAIKVVEEIRLVPHTDTVYVQQFERAVEVTYNQMSVSAENLISHLQDVGKTLGFEVLQPERIGRVGKQIVIPRDVIG